MKKGKQVRGLQIGGIDPDLESPFVAKQRATTRTKPFEKHRHNTFEDRHYCAAEAVFGQCANLVKRKGALCPKHGKLATPTASEPQPHTPSDGGKRKVISSSRRPLHDATVLAAVVMLGGSVADHLTHAGRAA